MITIEVVDWGGIFGVILTCAVKIVTLGVIWYCGLAIRMVSKTAPESMDAEEARPRKKGGRVEKNFSANTHYAPSVLTKPEKVWWKALVLAKRARLRFANKPNGKERDECALTACVAVS